MKLSGILVVAGYIVFQASSVTADSSLVGTWIIPNADMDVAEVDVADIDVEVVYRVCNSGFTKVDVTTVSSGDKPILKPLPVGSCVDVRVKPDQALKISGRPGAIGTYDLVFIVKPKP